MPGDVLSQSDAMGVGLEIDESVGDALTESDSLGSTETNLTFFCASSNSWIGLSSHCPITAPSPAASVYPVFDPSCNSWITSGAYGSGTPATYPFFCRSSNTWITSGTCP